MNSYSIYARFYDAIEGPQDDKINFLLDLITEYHPESKSLLEVACGTGNVLSGMKSKFELIEGLDISKEMIELAHKKLPNIKFYEKDMRSFNLNKSYDVILSIYDSMNHLLTLDDWGATFSNVHKHLNEDGIFIFDLNTEFRLLVIEDLSPYIVEFDGNYMVMEIERKTEEIYSNTIKIFEKESDGKYALHTETIKEATFSFEHIEKILDKYFELLSVRSYDNKSDTDIPPHKFVICRKKI